MSGITRIQSGRPFTITASAGIANQNPSARRAERARDTRWQAAERQRHRRVEAVHRRDVHDEGRAPEERRLRVDHHNAGILHAEALEDRGRLQHRDDGERCLRHDHPRGEAHQ